MENRENTEDTEKVLYGIIGLETSPVKVIAAPEKWIKELNLLECADDGVNQSKSTVVFYCSDLKKQADFSLPILDRFSAEPACYNGRIFKFEDKRKRAEEIAESHRCVLPRAYTEKKIKAAESKNKKNQIGVHDDCGYIDMDDQTESESKITERQKIRQQLQDMNGLFFDLTESDVEDFQDLLDESSEEENEFSPNDSVSTLEAQISLDIPNNIRLSVIHEDEAGQSELKQFSETGQSPTKNDCYQLASRDEDCENPIRLNFSGESEDLSNLGSNESNTQPVNNPKSVDSHTEIDVDYSSEFEFIPPDAKVPIPYTSKIEFNREFEFDPLNPITTSQSLNEPSCDDEFSGSNIRRLGDPNLLNITNTTSLRKELNEMQSTSDEGLGKNSKSTRIVDQENIYNDPVALHNAMHFLFPGECTFADNVFHFDSPNVILKVGMVSLLQSWNDTMPFSSNLYDRKFIDLLCAAITKKRPTTVMSNIQMRFVRESYMLRVKNNADRLTRFADYVQKYNKKRSTDDS